MNSLLTLAKDLEQKSKAQQQTTGEMLKAAFSEHEKSVRAELSESEKRTSAAILDHDRKLSSAMSQRHERDAAHGQPDVADHRSGLRAADSVERAGILWWQGQPYSRTVRSSGRRRARRPCCQRGTAAYISRPAASRDAAA
ncbi:MbeB family mobilization protein (plasmid) [Klebsiella pneumoniae]|nr:MbeB family mobilization protein [Klebsiella pneumoniae]